MTFRALSIDGGGMRGIYTAAYLDTLEGSFAKRRGSSTGLDIGKAFQLIVGTSTGAIIGCALVKGVPPTMMVHLYRTYGRAIFPQKMPSKLGWDLARQLFARPKYLKRGSEALRDALSNVFGVTTLRQVWDSRKIALAVPAVNMASYRSWVFKTPHDPTTDHRDDHYSLVDVCLASTAAPLFRSLAPLRDARGELDVFADGGLWANNPVLVTLCEALRIVGDRDDEIEIFALGTSGKPEGELISVDRVHRGLTAWRFGGEAAKISIAAQEFAFDMMAQFLRPHLKKRVHVIRFPSDKVPGSLLRYLDMDETSSKGLDALVHLARQDAHMTNSAIQRQTADAQAISALFQNMPPRDLTEGGTCDT